MTVLSTLKDKPQQLIKVACALRYKYRKGKKVRLLPCLVGWHPQNRGGAKLSGLRVLELTLDLLKKGFDAEEADCGGIVIESSMVMDFNVNACAGDPWLVATIDGQHLQFGTVSHSHLNQVLKNIGAGVDFSEVDDEVSTKLLDSTGKVQLDLLKAYDAEFHRYVTEGLLMEVLDPAIDVEEPEAAAIISAAANVKNAMSLIPHEMEALRLTSKHCSLEAKKSGDVAFIGARDKLAQSMPTVAHDPDFIHLFKFVVENGAEDSNHIAFLCDFLSKFVDPAKRRMRLAGFSVVTETLPLEAAHLRIAPIVLAYCSTPKNQYCDSPNKYVWKLAAEKHPDLVAHAQDVLLFYTETKKVDFVKVTPFDKIKFLGNLYKEVP